MKRHRHTPLHDAMPVTIDRSDYDFIWPDDEYVAGRQGPVIVRQVGLYDENGQWVNVPCGDQRLDGSLMAPGEL